MSTSLTVPDPVETTSDASGPRPLLPWRHVMVVTFMVSAVLGAIGMVIRLTQGHLPAGYGSYVPWGLWIAVYFHAVGIAAGAFLVTGVGYLMGWTGFRDPRALRLASVVVAAVMAPALLAVALDLGRMERAWRIILTPSFTSMMAFNTFAYLILLAIAAVVWLLAGRAESGWLKPFVMLGCVVSLMVPSQSGAFFGVVDAKPYWHSALLPPMLLTSAVVAGAALLLLVHRWLVDEPIMGFRTDPRESAQLVDRLRWIVLLGLAVYVIFEFAEYSIAYWNPRSDAPAIDLVLFGPYWWSFWLVHLVVGVLIVAGLLMTKSPLAWVVSSALVVVTLLSSRLNILIPGQSVGEIQGLQDAFVHDRLSYIYNPTLMEYLVCFFCLALGMGVFALGLFVTTRFGWRNQEGRSDD